MLRPWHGIILLLGLTGKCDLVESSESNNDQVRRRAQGCPDAAARGIDLPAQIPGHVLSLGQLVPLTTQLGLTDGNNPGFDTFKVFQDIDDVAIVAKRGTACYAVFRATTFNPLDNWQLYDFRSKTFGSCKVRQGFYDAYFSAYYDSFVNAVNDCMSDGQTELVLGGHSQGGSIAVVGSIGMKQYNPTVITFGAVRTLVALCSDIDPTRHYRFVNAANNAYDDWPMSFNKQAVHVGHAFLLDSQANPPAAYLGLNDNKNRSPSNKDVHKYPLSFEAFSKLFAMNCSPLRMSAWSDGHWCSGNEECLGSCMKSVCQPFQYLPVRRKRKQRTP